MITDIEKAVSLISQTVAMVASLLTIWEKVHGKK